MLNLTLSQVAIILLIVIPLLSALSMQLMTSYASVSIFISTALIMIGWVSYGKITRKFMFYILIFSLYMFISLYYSHGGIGSILTFILSILSLELLKNVNLPLWIKEYFKAFVAVMIIFLFIASFQYSGDKGFDYEGLVNPNTIALFANYCFCIYICLLQLRTNKIIIFILSIITLFTIINCEARGAFLAFISFILMICIPNKFLKPKLLMFSSVIIVAIGTLIPFIYLNLYEHNLQLQFVMNKPLFTGRQLIWIEALNLFEGNGWNWILGIGSKVKVWDFRTNLHNLYATIIVDFGFVGYLFYFGYIFNFIVKICPYIAHNDKAKRYFFMYIALSLIQGFTETTILNSTMFILANLGLAEAYRLIDKSK